MKILTYWILRLIIIGLGMGLLIYFIISEEIGIGWILGYTLCWVFSFINRNKNISQLEDDEVKE